MIERRQMILGLLAGFLIKNTSAETPSTLSLSIPPYSTIEFVCGEHKISFTAAEVMKALGTPDIIPTPIEHCENEGSWSSGT